MKSKLLLFLGTILLFSCGSSTNSDAFISEASGRYLFNADEILEVYFKEKVLYIKWRANDELKPLKVNDSTFYLAELNEKMIFNTKKEVINLAPKKEHEGVIYKFEKLGEGEKIPSEYIAEGDFTNALLAYQKIQKKDSLNPIIRQWTINRMGYDYMRKREYENALEIFKINNKLYPKSSNTFDSMADAYLRMKDTTKAIEYYKKALAINPENRSSKRQLKKITKK
ncbi:MAG: hypothetical protein CMB99_11825 [Flavobacteriaceae bacterium]|nr:hypothetical protein [Flavobacteriaceae bacterium]|tara:strand:- start:193640 stop:194317 length:678 start_codon:yes stop_codon:yes gene_type:complete